MSRPNVLLILTDQLRYPPSYESEELASFRANAMPGVERLRRERRLLQTPLSDVHGLRPESGIAADRASIRRSTA